MERDYGDEEGEKIIRGMLVAQEIANKRLGSLRLSLSEMAENIANQHREEESYIR